MHARVLRRSVSLPAMLLLLAAPGCGSRVELATRPDSPHHAPTAQVGVPGAAAQPGFYPLAIGNRWTYQRETIARLIPDEGVPPEPQMYGSRITREIAASVDFNGREYLIDRGVSAGGIPESDFLYRQDATGLYEVQAIALPAPAADLSPTARRLCAAVQSPAERTAFEQAARRIEARIASVHFGLRGMSAPADLRLPPTARPYELTRLRYPLAAKLRWWIRNDSQFRLSAEVIRQEALDLAPGHLTGYRIRIAREILGPAEYAYVWYGPSGYLQMVGHFELDAVDIGGTRIGRYLVDEREKLVELELVNPSPIAGLTNRPRRPK